MADKGKKTEFFVPAPACACSGAAFLRDAEKISRLEIMMAEIQERYPQTELVRYDMAEESAYAEG